MHSVQITSTHQNEPASVTTRSDINSGDAIYFALAAHMRGGTTYYTWPKLLAVIIENIVEHEDRDHVDGVFEMLTKKVKEAQEAMKQVDCWQKSVL